MHGLAFFFSFFNFARAACLFNERLTNTMLFATVALPFTVLTSLSRVILVVIVIAFIEPEWTAILLAGYKIIGEVKPTKEGQLFF